MKNLFLFILICCASAIKAETTYTDGVFILNEDWYGNNNSTINHLSTSGNFSYRIVKEANATNKLSLGCTSQFGTIYGDKLYVVSKQDEDPGESVYTGGRFVVADAKTMKIEKSIPIIFSINNKTAADGRSFVGVDETKGYIGTNNGIFVYVFASQTIVKRIEGTENKLITGEENNGSGTGPVYRNQIGIMIRTHDYVFAVQQDKGILVIDAETDKICHIFSGCFSTIIQSKDGSIWAVRNTNEAYQEYPYSNFGSSGEQWTGNELLRINPSTLETSTVHLAELSGIENLMVEQTWYAWTAGSLCASIHENALYFVYNDNIWSWFTKSHIYKYDIDKNTITEIYDTKKDNCYIYGAGIRINPLDDKLHVACYVGSNVSTNNFTFLLFDNKGTKQAFYTPIKNYWYPTLFIFPDQYEPEVTDFPTIKLQEPKTIAIPLSSMATDRDNLAASITKKVINVSNPDLIDAHVQHDTLWLTAKHPISSEESIVVRFNSNGKIVDKTVMISKETSSKLPVSSTENNALTIFLHDNCIQIDGLKTPTHVRILSSAGTLVTEKYLKKNDCIMLPQKGVFIVQINNSSYKIINK